MHTPSRVMLTYDITITTFIHSNTGMTMKCHSSEWFFIHFKHLFKNAITSTLPGFNLHYHSPFVLHRWDNTMVPVPVCQSTNILSLSTIIHGSEISSHIFTYFIHKCQMLYQNSPQSVRRMLYFGSLKAFIAKVLMRTWIILNYILFQHASDNTLKFCLSESAHSFTYIDKLFLCDSTQHSANKRLPIFGAAIFIKAWAEAFSPPLFIVQNSQTSGIWKSSAAVFINWFLHPRLCFSWKAMFASVISNHWTWDSSIF